MLEHLTNIFVVTCVVLAWEMVLHSIRNILHTRARNRAYQEQQKREDAKTKEEPASTP